MKIHYLTLTVICIGAAIFTIAASIANGVHIAYVGGGVIFTFIFSGCLFFYNGEKKGDYYHFKINFIRQKKRKEEIKDALLQRMKDADKDELDLLIEKIENL